MTGYHLQTKVDSKPLSSAPIAIDRYGAGTASIVSGVWRGEVQPAHNQIIDMSDWRLAVDFAPSVTTVLLTMPDAATNELLSLLEVRGIRVPDRPRVEPLLVGRPKLVHAIRVLAEAAAAEFAEGQELSLEVYTDQELQAGYPVLMVRMDAYPTDTLDRLLALTDANADALAAAEVWFDVTTDYEPVTSSPI